MAEFRPNAPELNHFLRTPGGRVSKWVTQRGRNVEGWAKWFAPVGEPRAVYGKDTRTRPVKADHAPGTLRRSIRARVIHSPDGPQAVIGPDLRIAPHARWVIQGTRGPIVPLSGQFFRPFMHGGKIHVGRRSVAGQKAQPFMQAALEFYDRRPPRS